MMTVVATSGLAGCSSSVPRPVSPVSPGPSALTVPLATTFPAPTGTFAIVAMGTLSDPLNTFWQLFFRPSSGSQWSLVTPPGVADNGGLVASSSQIADPSAGPPLLAGFEPSQALAFSPLAASTDWGTSWSPGLVPTGLAAVPDAVSTSAGTRLLALGRAAGGEVLDSDGNLSAWSVLAARGAIASGSSASSCGVGVITAVASSSAGAPLVGTTCTARGIVGVLTPVEGRWRVVGPRLAGRPGRTPTEVLRLVEVDGATEALVASADGSTTNLVAVAASGPGWSQSPPLFVPARSHIVSTGVVAGGGFVVLVAGPGSHELAVESGPAGSWQSLPAPPAGTAAVSVGLGGPGSAGGQVDALVVASTRFSDWRLDAGSGTWSKIAAVKVPIQFGSSD